MKYAIAIIVLLTAILVVGYIDKPVNPIEKTLSVCNQAHKEINSFSENYCGELQDQYNLEFLCNDDRPSSHCWVESR